MSSKPATKPAKNRPTKSAKKKPARKAPAPESIYTIRVALQYLKPEIWREFLVPDNLTLGDLHQVLYRVMGWQGYHMHLFHLGSRTERTYYSTQDMLANSSNTLHEDSVILRDILTRKGTTFTYEYDMGDSWFHDVSVVKISPFDPSVRLPLCTAGERACPPEDCGSFPGYENILRALKKPKSADDRELLNWLGEFDPEHFSVDEVNLLLAAQLRLA
jgi:hypothetical protein